ncbi:MAG TPA: hypothetical protein VKT18_06815 [Acidimicrobiales bacterium]|nr:hypothetical protein [Acidimicrobiales bacterium]
MTDAALELVDLARYPLDDPDGEGYAAAVADARAQLAKTGAAELRGFVTPDGVTALQADADALAVRAHHSSGLGTAYLELPDDHWAPDHPRQTWAPYAVGAVGYDVIPHASPLRRLYESPALLAFLEAVLDRGTLHRYADGCGALNLAVMGEGDELQWHFDQTDFVVSLAIQAAESGGDFDVVPKVRSANDERYDEVARVLAGTHEGVVTLPMTPGTLLVFEGRHSIHRVSPIAGPRLRHVGLLAYDTTPGTTSSDLLREVRYGRATPFPSPPATWPPS